ncbi:two-component system response regulator QseB [Microlunatus panaciterrae]|uniref:Two-component system response regulator QseB n=1 Tax=Microlunatus panaciterrae TaxID=400768 RepID=A0ABS2RF97_9ACTN|nr:response regulator transcription factor [Microlunatus panaciterrae]MBM7797666.1 two-component system response regulator QseB [Microlunatus panaciterrae]
MTEPTEPAPRLLLVEDDRDLAEMLTEILRSEGYLVEAASDGQQGLHLALSRPYELMVLDRGLPAIEGLDLLTRLRSRGVVTPVLVLSALGLPRDRVDGLNAGAEDYLSKPFDLDELLARLRALLRRHREEAESLTLPCGRFVIDSRTVLLTDGRTQVLSDRESSLLEVFARRPQQVFSRQELMSRVFPDAEEEGVVDTYVHYLRRKLGKASVRTIRGLGYQLGRS